MSRFHVLMMFLGVIGTHFKDDGLQDVLIQSGFLADGSAQRAMTGSVYNRSVRMCKLMYEALNKMLVTKMKKIVVSIEDIYNVLLLDWNNEFCYRKFFDSKKMEMYAIEFYKMKEFANRLH